MNAATEKSGHRKTSDKAKAHQLRIRAEAALADVRRRSEYLSGSGGKGGK